MFTTVAVTRSPTYTHSLRQRCGGNVIAPMSLTIVHVSHIYLIQNFTWACTQKTIPLVHPLDRSDWALISSNTRGQIETPSVSLSPPRVTYRQGTHLKLSEFCLIITPAVHTATQNPRSWAAPTFLWWVCTKVTQFSPMELRDGLPRQPAN